jgi:aminopeptidase N
MKKLIFSLSILVLSACSLYAQQLNSGKGSEMCSQRKSMNSQLVARTFRSAYALEHAFNVLKYTINIDLTACLQGQYPNNFNANVKILFEVDSTLNQIVLDAVNSSLTVTGIQMNGVSYTHTGDKLTIQLDRTYNVGEQAEVQIFYTHANVIDGAFYCSGGFLFTDCEPEGARKWFPCYDRPSDKAMTDITAKVPITARLGSNGRLQDSIINGNTISYHWVSRDPVATYLTVLTARIGYNLDIVNWTNPTNSEVIPFRFYYNPGEDPSYIKSIIDSMTSFYSEEFGDHPFEKNGFATLNNEFAWGGMENQTLTSLCPNCWGESLIAHEFAHQWFGDMITCATWADIFLNEGFATWTEAYWIEHQGGYEAYKNELSWNADYYKAYNPGWAISVPSWAITTPGVNTLFDYAITYMKGSCVLHMLRYTLGDSVFFSAMKAYATDTVGFKYKSVTIDDFKNKMENESGKDLDWFFDQWVYKPNHPVYRNVYGIMADNEDKWIVNFTANQEVQAFTPYFQMPLELLVNFKDGSDSLVKVFNSFNGQNFSFLFDKEPETVTFDPNNEILLKNGTTVVGIDELAASNTGFSLNASPNPIQNLTRVTYSLNTPDFVDIDLYNSTGVKLSTITEKYHAAGEHSVEFNSERLTAGIYFIVLRTARKTESLKIVKSE